MPSKKSNSDSKCVLCKHFPKNEKSVRISENPGASNSMTPSWCFNQMDINHPRWNPRKMQHKGIVDILLGFEGLTWQEILCAPKSHGEGSKNHPVQVSDLSKSAQVRLHEINKDDVDELFSLRLDGRKRLYGIRQQRSFIILWYDSIHEIYPLQSK